MKFHHHRNDFWSRRDLQPAFPDYKAAAVVRDTRLSALLSLLVLTVLLLLTVQHLITV